MKLQFRTPLISFVLAVSASLQSGLALDEKTDGETLVTVFTNEAGDSLFSEAMNWEGGTLPLETSRVDVNEVARTSRESPALVDPAWLVKTGPTLVQGVNGAFLRVEPEAKFWFNNLQIGSPHSKRTGRVEVAPGATIETTALRQGVILVGDEGGGNESELVFSGRVSAGRLPNLVVHPDARLELAAHDANLPTLKFHGETQFRIDGLLRITLKDDLPSGRYPLLVGTGSGVAGLSGELRKQFDEGGGTLQGKGDSLIGNHLEISGSNNRSWALLFDETINSITLELED